MKYPADMSEQELTDEVTYPPETRLTGWYATDADIERSNACHREKQKRESK